MIFIIGCFINNGPEIIFIINTVNIFIVLKIYWDRIENELFKINFLNDFYHKNHLNLPNELKIGFFKIKFGFLNFSFSNSFPIIGNRTFLIVFD